MYEVKEIKSWFSKVLHKNNLTEDSDYDLIRNIKGKIESLSIIKNSTFLDFYLVRDIYMSIEKIEFIKKV